MERAIPEGARALERLTVRIQTLGRELLSLEMYERWGGGRDEAMNRAVASSTAAGDRIEAQTALAALVEQCRREDPDAIAYWSDAHDQLLARFLDETTDATATFVARGERDAWRALKTGGPLVDENTFYVQVDRALHEHLFGTLTE